MKKSILLIILMLSGTLIAQEKDAVVVPKIVVKMGLGQSVVIGDTTLKFVEVLEDSRCPKNVTCIWQGRVRISVEVSLRDGSVKLKELIFGQTKPGELGTTILYSYDDYLLKGIAVTPYPDIQDTGEKNYELLISEEN